MIDSQMLCMDWKDGFRRIQNTEQYGKVDHFSDKPGTLVGGESVPEKPNQGGFLKLKRSQGGFL